MNCRTGNLYIIIHFVLYNAIPNQKRKPSAKREKSEIPLLAIRQAKELQYYSFPCLYIMRRREVCCHQYIECFLWVKVLVCVFAILLGELFINSIRDAIDTWMSSYSYNSAGVWHYRRLAYHTSLHRGGPGPHQPCSCIPTWSPWVIFPT